MSTKVNTDVPIRKASTLKKRKGESKGSFQYRVDMAKLDDAFVRKSHTIHGTDHLPRRLWRVIKAERKLLVDESESW
jgi:hypothetical protein